MLKIYTLLYIYIYIYIYVIKIIFNFQNNFRKILEKNFMLYNIKKNLKIFA